MRFYANENDILSGRRGAMAIEMLQNVIQSQDLLLRGFPRKGNRPRPHWMDTAFNCSFMDVDEDLVKALQSMGKVKLRAPKKKVFRSFVKKRKTLVEITQERMEQEKFARENRERMWGERNKNNSDLNPPWLPPVIWNP